MNVLEEIKNDVQGLSLLRDWLGDGEKPVRQYLADVHGATCLDCSEHRPGRWWEDATKGMIAETIRRELEIKHKLKLETVMDETLGMCRVCGCCVRLKIWTPAKHLKAHTLPEVLAKYPPTCWVPSEIENV